MKYVYLDLDFSIYDTDFSPTYLVFEDGVFVHTKGDLCYLRM